MNLIPIALAGLALGATPLLAEPATSVPPPDLAGEVVSVLQARYPDFSTLHYKAGDHLSDLMARSNGRISLIGPGNAAARPIFSQVLPDGIVYWRLESLSPEKNWDALAATLRPAALASSVAGVVLDLRGNGSDDYAGAARVLSLFVPGDTSLAKHPEQDSSQNSIQPGSGTRFQGPVIVMTNSQTASAAEALAGCLKSDGALLVGRTTFGLAFADHPLSDGTILRFAVAAAAQPGNAILRPVTPDIQVKVEERAEKAALNLIRDHHLLDVIQEDAARHRMSEAALVQGQDPEWDAYLATLEKAPVLLSLPPVHDEALVVALDSLRAIHLSERSAPVQAASIPSHPEGTSVQ